MYRHPRYRVTNPDEERVAVYHGVGQDSVDNIATCYGMEGRGSNPGGGEIFCVRPDRPWVPPSLLYNGYRVCFPGLKLPGRGVNHTPYLVPN
jgi:hypothetical protein